MITARTEITADVYPVMDLVVQWSDIADDAQIISITEGILDKSIALAKSKGLYHRFIYQNYAYITQDVFSGTHTAGS